MAIILKKKSCITLLGVITILLLFPSFASKEYLYKLTELQFYSEIQLTIKGRGDQYILSTGIPFCTEYEGPLPDYLWINEESQRINKEMIYYLTEEYNYMTLKWNSPLNSTAFMFNGVKNITKIDILHFDSTQLKSMEFMFTNLNLLTFIDLSILDTTLVTNFGFLFKGCSSLISLDLSNFNTSNEISMRGMFYFSEKIKYLNINSFTSEKLNDTDLMFEYMSFYIIFEYCIDKTKGGIVEKIISQISSSNNCSNTCFLPSAIFLIDEKKCILSDEHNISFPYEYNNECNKTCPKRTRINFNNID